MMRAINEPIAADLLEDLQRGRLSQTCKPCAITEAAGYSCTSCERPTGLADWYRPALSDAKRASLVRAHVARRNGSQMNHGPQGETYASATGVIRAERHGDRSGVPPRRLGRLGPPHGQLDADPDHDRAHYREPLSRAALGAACTGRDGRALTGRCGSNDGCCSTDISEPTPVTRDETPRQ